MGPHSASKSTKCTITERDSRKPWNIKCTDYSGVGSRVLSSPVAALFIASTPLINIRTCMHGGNQCQRNLDFLRRLLKNACKVSINSTSASTHFATRSVRSLANLSVYISPPGRFTLLQFRWTSLPAFTSIHLATRSVHSLGNFQGTLPLVPAFCGSCSPIATFAVVDSVTSFISRTSASSFSILSIYSSFVSLPTTSESSYIICTTYFTAPSIESPYFVTFSSTAVFFSLIFLFPFSLISSFLLFCLYFSPYIIFIIYLNSAATSGALLQALKSSSAACSSRKILFSSYAKACFADLCFFGLCTVFPC